MSPQVAAHMAVVALVIATYLAQFFFRHIRHH